MFNKKKLYAALGSVFAVLTFVTVTYLAHLGIVPQILALPSFCLALVGFVGTIVLLIPLLKMRNTIKKSILRWKQKNRAKVLICIIVLTILYTIFIALSKFYHCYGIVDVEQILYHTLVSASGMDFSTVFAIAIPSLIGTAVFTICINYILFVVICIATNDEESTAIKSVPKYCFVSTILASVLVIAYLLSVIPILEFAYYQCFTKSDFIEKQYVEVESENIEFPEEKRNLIYIYMESMENAFADTSNGGAFVENLMPEITKLQKEHICFSHTENIGGALRTYGATYTTAGIFANSFALPLKVGNLTPSNNRGTFLTNRNNIFDIMNDAGYQQYVAMGSDVAFGGLDELFASHGNTTVIDYNTIKGEGYIDENYRVFWGVEDAVLYSYAKEKLNEISSSDKPFFFVLETVDTHNPNGYVCNYCRDEHDEQYANVVSCASRQLYDFVTWAQKQSWYDNTTIVVVGDHLSMKNDFFVGIDNSYVRTTINLIINPVQKDGVSESILTNRKFSSIDMMPTTLSAIGCKIEGNRLGLGTNLFSGKPTIFEEFGYEYVNEEFRKNSTFFSDIFA